MASTQDDVVKIGSIFAGRWNQYRGGRTGLRRCAWLATCVVRRVALNAPIRWAATPWTAES